MIFDISLQISSNATITMVAVVRFAPIPKEALNVLVELAIV